ncbi:PDR/VanB family oxidoreductase [[Mycobacterium] nativiensis]|uniref:PDR/VanB family oxidoreductase n=1 Tax=[Mycobacterium] nativiensis TaxID=2855503 RepID=A0ABU5XXZ5_9MYCO|nr:PDR/VanB family oxidoreductase [Mycolicibacter sp. MYC340]MEB3031886.1 PDR/VanB family oxidoreductase [Mycolicibacter sp. MYC340]
MSYLTAPATDLSRSTPTLQMLSKLAWRYSRTIAGSSPSQPVRHAGFSALVQVAEKRLCATDVAVLTLARPDRRPLPAWGPGAHIDVFTPIGRQRHYSLTGDPADAHSYRIAVRRIPDGAGSAELHDLDEGGTLRIRGPRNAFRLVDEPTYHFIAGGIGITPILPMIHQASARGARWTLDYLGRSRSAMPFLDELELLADSGTLRIHCDDEHGMPAIADLFADVEPSPVYLCGPSGLMDAVNAYLAGTGSPSPQVHSERFRAAVVRDGAPFTIVLARSGMSVPVAADETALDAIRRRLPTVNYSCQQGFCGTCRTGLIAGDIEHRDRVLVADEQCSNMMICVSRAAEPGGEVVLDL